MRKIKLFLFFFLLLLSGYTQARVLTVTSADGGKTVSGSLYLVTRSLSDGDILTFADDVKQINLTTNVTFGNSTWTSSSPNLTYSITVLGNGVTISTTASTSINIGKSNCELKNATIKNLNFKNIAINTYAGSLTVENCTFKADAYNITNTIYSSSNHTNYTALFNSCAFIGKGNYGYPISSFINTNPNLAITESHSFVSCTFINENGTSSYGNILYENTQTQTSYARSTTFTNCVLLDNSYDSNPSIKLTNFSSNGYNVIQGSVNGAWSASPSWGAKGDVILQKTDASPLTNASDVYQVHVGGPAYRHLPANTTIDGITFPTKDLAGTVIDYSKTTHSGAWQAVDGPDIPEEVAITGITIGGAGNGDKVFTETTRQLSAGVQPNGVTEQGATWSSSDQSIATVDANGLVTFLPTASTDTTETKSVTITATSVALNSVGQHVTASVTLTVKPYVHVASVTIYRYGDSDPAVACDTIRSLINQGIYIKGSVLPANANNRVFTWSVDDPSIAGVSFTNNIYSVKGKKAGQTVLRAIAADGSVQGTCVLIYHDNSVYAGSDGVYMLTEGNYPGTGGLNYLFPDGNWDYNVYTTFSGGRTFGVTTEYGAFYGDKAYFVSKQGPRLVVTDADPITEQREFWNIGTVGTNSIDGRAFVGVDEHTGYVGTSSGICVVNLDSLPNVAGDRVENNNVVAKAVTTLPYTSVAGSGSNGGLYSQQVGTMIRVGNRVFAVQQAVGLLVINALTNKLDTVLTGYNYATLTLSKDGYLWSGTTKYVSSGSLDEASSNVLLRIDPWTLQTTEIALPSGYAGPVSYWGAWQPDAVAASPKENKLYWTSGKTICAYDIATNTIQTVFNAADMALPSDFPTSTWAFYGSSFGVHPVTGELYAWITLFNLSASNPERQVWEVVKINPQTGAKTAYPMSRQYWWPSMMLFPDKQAPVLSVPDLTLAGDTAVALNDKVTDGDNMSVAIVKSISGLDNTMLDISLWRDSLKITPKVAKGTTSFTLKANSNGKVVTQTVNVNIALPAPQITLQPQSAVKNYGDSVSFSVAASGSFLSYQWYKDGTAISNATAATYSIASAAMGTLSQGKYNCIVSNASGSAPSDTATLTLNSNLLSKADINNAAWNTGAPYVVPESVTNTDLEITLFPVNANIAVYYGSQLLTDNTYHVDITKPLNKTFTFTLKANSGYSANYDVTINQPSDLSAPAIIGQPASLTRNYGESATFTVTASGSKLTYQWYKGTTALSGATQATYTVTAADMSSSSQGSYYCVVTNPYGTATSQTATLTVNSNLLSGTTIGSVAWDITTPYLVAQGATATDLAITLQPVNANIAVYYGAQLLTDNTYHMDISKPLNKTYTFTLKAGNGYSVNYTVSVEKRFDFDAIVVTRWNNTLLVNANNTSNGGFGFTTYAWFKDGVQVGTEQYYSAGSHKSDVLSGSYYVVMTTSDGQTLRTWAKTVSVQSSASLKVSPNPVNAGAQLSVQLDLEPGLLDKAVIEVYNTYGTNLQKARATGSTTQLSVPGQTGIYVVRVHAEGYTGEAKVVVK